jgi:hypothetical protein
LHAIEFFDEDNKLLMSAGFFHNPKATTRDIYLEEGERIVGIVSRIEKRYAEQAIHRDFQLILAQLV